MVYLCIWGINMVTSERVWISKCITKETFTNDAGYDFRCIEHLKRKWRSLVHSINRELFTYRNQLSAWWTFPAALWYQEAYTWNNKLNTYNQKKGKMEEISKTSVVLQNIKLVMIFRCSFSFIKKKLLNVIMMDQYPRPTASSLATFWLISVESPTM